MIVSLPTTMSVSKTLHLLKEASSHEIFQRIPVFRKRDPRGAFWIPGKFYRTIGDADAKTFIDYVRNNQFQLTTIDRFSGAP